MAKTGAGGITDATTTVKGKIKLAGSLGGTADSPTVVTNANLTGDVTSSGNATTLAVLNKSTLTTDSNPYKFSVYRNSALTINTGANKVTMDTELYDTNNNFATGTYTAPVAGFYHFDAAIHISTVGGQDGYISLYVGGAEVKRGFEIVGTSGTGGFTVSADLQLSANDTVEVYSQLAAASRSIVTGSIHSYFTGHLISRT